MADQKLVDYLVAQGHSQERAEQIAGNHPDAVRADMEKAKATPAAASAPSATAPAKVKWVRNERGEWVVAGKQ
jgi:hypothetical protein